MPRRVRGCTAEIPTTAERVKTWRAGGISPSRRQLLRDRLSAKLTDIARAAGRAARRPRDDRVAGPLLALLVLQFFALADMRNFGAAIRAHGSCRRWACLGAAAVRHPLRPTVDAGNFPVHHRFWCAGRAVKNLRAYCSDWPARSSRRWRRRSWSTTWHCGLNVGGVAAAVAAAMWIAAIVAMSASTSMGRRVEAEIGATTQVGGVNDYGPANPFHDEIVDIKMLLVASCIARFLLQIAG